jgi:hypothetical protein
LQVLVLVEIETAIEEPLPPFGEKAGVAAVPAGSVTVKLVKSE